MPHALLVARQRSNRKRAAFACGIGAQAFVYQRVARKDDLEDALFVTRRIDDVMDVRRDTVVRVRRGLDGAEFVAPLRVRAYVTAQPWIAVVVVLRRVETFGVGVINVDGNTRQRRLSVRPVYATRHSQTLARLIFCCYGDL